MDTTRHHEAPDTSFGHETSDVDLAVIDRVGILSLAVIIVSALAMWGLMKVFLSMEAAKDPSPLPVAVQGDRQPPSPVLQRDEPGDLKAFRDTEDATLHTYGWLDRNAGTVHIPVERAMDLVVERGFPPRDPSVLQQLQAAQPGAPPPAPAKP